MTCEVRHYLTVAGADPFAELYKALRDRQAQARVQVRLDRLERPGRRRGALRRRRVGTADRLGAGLPGVLRPGREYGCALIAWR